MNRYKNDNKRLLKEFNETLCDIYDNDKNINFLYDYHNNNDFSFFIGLCEEDLNDIDCVFSYEDRIILEDFRMCSGSNYYFIKKKTGATGITLRDIFEDLKHNIELKKLLDNIDNENIILTDIMKCSNSKIHYTLMFSDCF